MVWIFLTRCCSYDSLTWTMETLLGAYTFLLLFEWAAKTWNFVAVVALFFKCSFGLFVCFTLFLLYFVFTHFLCMPYCSVLFSAMVRTECVKFFAKCMCACACCVYYCVCMPYCQCMHVCSLTGTAHVHVFVRYFRALAAHFNLNTHNNNNLHLNVVVIPKILISWKIVVAYSAHIPNTTM